MKNFKIILASLLTAATLSGCYKEDEVVSEIGKLKYTIEDSSDPVDHYIFNVYTGTGVKILYDYQTIDYLWSFSTIEPNLDVEYVTDKANVEGLDAYLDATLFNYFTDEQLKKYAPYNILLADTVTYNTNSTGRYAYCGRSYMLLGGVNGTMADLTDEELEVRKGILIGSIWGRYLFQNGIVKIPNNFFEPSDEFYGVNLKLKDPNPNTLNFGFWDRDENGYGYTGTTYYMAPSKEADVQQYVGFIASHTTEEVMAKMEGYPLMVMKYNIITNYIKETYGVDIQAIGDKQLIK